MQIDRQIGFSLFFSTLYKRVSCICEMCYLLSNISLRFIHRIACSCSLFTPATAYNPTVLLHFGLCTHSLAQWQLGCFYVVSCLCIMEILNIHQQRENGIRNSHHLSPVSTPGQSYFIYTPTQPGVTLSKSQLLFINISVCLLER